jgi:hypothetical protein
VGELTPVSTLVGDDELRVANCLGWKLVLGLHTGRRSFGFVGDLAKVSPFVGNDELRW